MLLVHIFSFDFFLFLFHLSGITVFYLAFDDLSVDLSDSIIEQETLDLLYDAIEHLPDELRTVFSLSFEQGLKNEEIAIQLQCSVGTVKNRKNSIIRFLRQHITARQLVTFLAICPATY